MEKLRETGRIVEAERSDANCTLEMENIGQKSEDHSLASQIEEIGHGMEEGDDDDNMSDIPSQCGDEQLYTVKEINDFLDETFGRKSEVRVFSGCQYVLNFSNENTEISRFQG